MFDPSQQLHDYFVQKGHSDLEAHKLANEVSGRCPPMWLRAHNQTLRTCVNSAFIQNMQETQEQTESEIIDFGFDATEADLARPVIQNGIYDAEVAFTRHVRTKNTPEDEKPNQLSMGFRLTQSAKTVDGKEVNPGFMVFHRTLTRPTGDLTQKMIEDRLKRYQAAIAGPGRVTTAEWAGKPVRVKVTLREARVDEKTGNSYDASNDVGGIFPAKKS